jgi:hypothetical protein
MTENSLQDALSVMKGLFRPCEASVLAPNCVGNGNTMRSRTAGWHASDMLCSREGILR